MTPRFRALRNGTAAVVEGVMPPSFWEKFVELNREMLRANSTLKKEHRWASHWWEWPLMLKTILYWRASSRRAATAERPHARVYCIGTPPSGGSARCTAPLRRRRRRPLSSALRRRRRRREGGGAAEELSTRRRRNAAVDESRRGQTKKGKAAAEAAAEAAAAEAKAAARAGAAAEAAETQARRPQRRRRRCPAAAAVGCAPLVGFPRICFRSLRCSASPSYTTTCPRFSTRLLLGVASTSPCRADLSSSRL